MQNFWNNLPRPFFVLAPLANVTDAAFRRIIAKYSKPSGPQVMFTEFVSADGLMRATPEGKAKLMRDLVYTDAERPIVAQLFTSNPEIMEAAATLVADLGFDGIDINMGCPDKSIEKQGAGAALIKNPERAAEVIAAAKRGSKGLPVSIKTRLGYNKDVLDDWLPILLKAEPVAITLHSRTRKEMSKVPAHWERVKRAVEIRNELGSQTLIVGNGDVQDLNDARVKAAESGADGIMLGRAIFGRPWLFASDTQRKGVAASERCDLGRKGVALRAVSCVKATPCRPVDIEERLRITLEHTKLFEELLGDIKSFALMKKHFKAYVEGFDGAKELRMSLMEAENAAQVEEIIETFILHDNSARATNSEVE